MHVYLAGGMRGRDPKVVELLFRQGAAKLRRAGHSVFSPYEHDLETTGEYNGDSTPLSTVRLLMKQDQIWICDNANIIALLPGWEKSKGATAEKALGDALEDVEVWLPEQWFYDEPSVDGKDMNEHLRLRNQEWDKATGSYR